MDIMFGSKKLRKHCTTDREMVRRWGKRQSELIRRRLDQVRAAETLEIMRRLPGRCHELKGNRAGRLSLDLVHPFRLVFEPADEPVPLKDDGGLDWVRVTAVMMLGVEDTHE